MWVIFEREIKALFRNIRAVICIAVMSFISALFLAVNNLSAGYSGMQSVLSNMSLVSALIIPLVASGIICGGRISGRDDLLDFMPVTLAQIIMGKFFAVAAFLMIPTAIMSVYPVLLSSLGGAPVMQGLIMLFVFVIFQVFLTALCFMVSSLCQKKWKAVVISYSIIVITFILGLISPLFNGALRDILRFISPFRRFDPTVFDLLDISSIVFYLSLSALFLWVAATSYKKMPALEVKARAIKKRTAVISVALAAAVLFINIAAYIIPSAYRQIDISSEGSYYISSGTKDYLDKLDDEITLYLIDPISSEEKLHTFIKRYCELADNVTLKEVYTDEEPSFLTEYGISSSVAYYSIIAQSKKTGRWKLVSTEEYFKYYNGSYGFLTTSEYEEATTYYTQMYSYYYQNPTGAEEYLEAAEEALFSLMYQTSMCIDAERAITTAIEYVAAESVPTLYFVSGHGEKEASSNPWDIEKNGNIPSDAALVVINDPESDYTAREISLLQEYSDRGGKLLVITDDKINERPNLSRLLACFGLSAERMTAAENGKVTANVNISSGALKDIPFDQLTLSGVSSIIPTDNEELIFSKLFTVGESEEEQKTVAMSVSQNGAKKIVWFTGADSFNADITDMSDEEKTEYTKAVYCLQSAVSWLWTSFASSLKFDNPAEYEPAMLIAENGTVSVINVMFIGIVPLTIIGAAWISIYVRKKRSKAAREAE